MRWLVQACNLPGAAESRNDFPTVMPEGLVKKQITLASLLPPITPALRRLRAGAARAPEGAGALRFGNNL
jgi:hypothetical protein